MKNFYLLIALAVSSAGASGWLWKNSSWRDYNSTFPADRLDYKDWEEIVFRPVIQALQQEYLAKTEGDKKRQLKRYVQMHLL